MKKILIIPLIFFCIWASAQAPPYTRINFGYYWYGGAFDRLHIPAFNTTPSIKSGQWTGSGAIGIDSVLHRYYFYSGGQWRRLALYTDISASQIDSLRRLAGSSTVEARKAGVWISQFTDSSNAAGVPPPTGYGVVTPGIITWLHDLVYNVSPATYWINGTLYTSPSTDITLDAADATDDRIDEVVGTTSGTVAVVTGTPANPAVEPNIDPDTQMSFGFILVYANTTAPPPTLFANDTIYVSSTSGWVSPISSNSGNLVVNSTNNPYSATESIEGTNVANNNQVSFTKGSAATFSNYSNFIFHIRNTGGWASNRKLILTFYNGTSQVGNSIIFGTGSYGFSLLNTTTYQQITIPISDFGSISTADKFILRASMPSGTIGHFNIDDIILQGGVSSSPPPTNQNFVSNIFRKPGVDSIYFKIGSTTFAIKDSTAGSFSTPGIDDVLAINQDLTADRTIGGAFTLGTRFFALTTSANATYLKTSIGGSDYAFIGTSGGTNQLFTGSALGDLIIKNANSPIKISADGSTEHLKINPDGSIALSTMTATAASALTPVEGMIVFVNNTNGTFTSIGLWDYENGAWHKL